MNINNIEITKLIPQQNPMIMVDKLLSYSEKEVQTTFTIKTNNIFICNNVLQEVALIENIAQTAAAGTGYNALLKSTPPQKGFIGAVKNFEVYKRPIINDILVTKLTVITEIFNASIVLGEIFCNNSLIAKAELKIFLLEENNR